MIRKHTPSDLEDILDIWYQASTLAHPFLDDDFVEMISNEMRHKYIPGSETWIYEEKGKSLGFVGMQDNEIGGLFVLPSHHSKGIGTQLVNYVKTLHSELEVEVFENNLIGKSFYEKYGFKVIKEYLFEPANQLVLRMKYTS